jgi:hypothetical protein
MFPFICIYKEIRGGEMRNVIKILVGKPEGRGHLEDIGLDKNAS